jgi:gamma-glutamylcyclotransferase (GGCT)/AIG2-like uncharacterized protein YtfP
MSFFRKYLSGAEWAPEPAADDERLPFAVYGTLMRGHGRGKWTERYGDYGGECLIRGELWDVGAFPALLLGSDLVVGQLFIPDAETYDELVRRFDEIEGYRPGGRSLYERRRVRLAHPDVDAWTYVWAGGTGGLRRIPSGSWAEHVGLGS